ncbi:SH3 domain-containing protein [Streptomyces subrutilus]|uniref:SH3 domain-containing protein n=1 Tax=Streptomyces subrutilus TaxID=36818 RepID=UPI00340C41F6
MLKPTRTILALAAGSLVLGLVGAGTTVADEQPMAAASSEQSAAAGLRHSIGKVVSRGPLKVRSKPTTRSQAVGHVYPNRTVEIRCKKNGESVDGNRLWYRLYDRDSQDNGNNENGNPGNGFPGNGNTGNGTWPGSGNPNAVTGAGSSTSDKAVYAHQRWVSARYVQNLGSVRFCR